MPADFFFKFILNSSKNVYICIPFWRGNQHKGNGSLNR